MGSLVNSTKHLRKKLYQFSPIYFRILAEGILPRSFFEASINLIPKLDKGSTKKGNYRPVSIMNTDKSSNINKFNPKKYKKNYIQRPSKIYSKYGRLVPHWGRMAGVG